MTGTSASISLAGVDNETEYLCDVQANGTIVPFARTTTYDPAGAVVNVVNTTLTGTPYVITGTPWVCQDPAAPVITASAQHQLLAAAGVWTPALVTGVLLSVSFAILSGTATVLDQNGTSAAALPAGMSASWSVADSDVLTGPQSITAGAASSVYVNWTQRP